MKKNLEIDAIKKILVIRWGALGDLSICTAVFQDISMAFPKVQIDLNTEETWCSLFEDDDRFIKIIPLLNRHYSKFKSLWQWFKKVNAEKYDLIIDLQGNDRSYIYILFLILFGSAPKYRVGNKSFFPYNILPEKKSTGMHALMQYQIPLRAMGITPKTKNAIFKLNNKNNLKGKFLLGKNFSSNKKIIAIVPGSSESGINKRWGVKNYTELGRVLIDDYKCSIVIIGDKKEVSLGEQIKNDLGENALNLCGKTSLQEAYFVIALCAALIGNDSGLTHMASATRRPVVVICGPTNSEIVKPIGGNVAVLQADLECFKNFPANSCMDAISVEDVLSKLKYFLV